MKSSICKGHMEITLRSLPEISEEVLIEILIKFPAKSLMRFKCVSKLWLSLITSRYFTNHFLKSSSRRRLFVYLVEDLSKYALLTLSSSHDHSVSVIDQDLNMPRIDGYFVGAARGLACFRVGERLRVCNLHTRQVVELPPVMGPEPINKNNKWDYFGYDHVHDEYKVLTYALKDRKEKRVQRQVLALGAGVSWRKIQCNIPHIPFHTYSESISIDGVLYYGALTVPYGWGVMSFDLSSEEFNLIESPRGDCNCTSLMNYKGKLAFLDYRRLWRNGTVVVWVVEDFKKSRFSNKKTFVLPLSRMSPLEIGCTSRSCRVWLTKEDFTYFIYDFEKNEITQRIEIRPPRDKIGMIMRAIGCSQLLGSFNNIDWTMSTFWDDIESIMYLEI